MEDQHYWVPRHRLPPTKTLVSKILTFTSLICEKSVEIYEIFDDNYHAVGDIKRGGKHSRAQKLSSNASNWLATISHRTQTARPG